MNRARFQAIASLGFALILILMVGTHRQAQAQDRQTSYPSMAPIEQYLIRIAMLRLPWREARRRRPYPATNDSVLGRHGYETAVEGKNGWVCAVERAWMSPFDAANFWNPKIRGPLCLNPPAVRSILPITYKRTEMILAGKSKAEIIEALKTAYEKRELPPVEPGAMSYMMSKDQYLSDEGQHNWMAHLMFYTPLMDGAVWVQTCPSHP